MNPIAMAVVSVSGIGLLCAVLLAVAARFMSVPVDERFPVIRGILPGANCGACGYAGCDAYAQAMLDDPTVKSNLCVPGADSVSRALSDALGVAFEDVVARVAVVRCQGNCDNTSHKMDYHGIDSCKAARLLYSGPGTCSYGCMGFGDCAKVCPYHAICIAGDGLAHINPLICIGCGLCADVCPNGVIELFPNQSTVHVACNNHDKGAVAMKVCKTSCIACKKCEKACLTGAITVVDQLAHIDQSKCNGCGTCVETCPKKCIVIETLCEKE
ncbi:MAG: RnfABCDGE type electron transport complex subunit B [Oscillospiraceae bacterium]